jgi:hypothetical protein
MPVVDGRKAPVAITRRPGKYKEFRVFFNTDKSAYIALCTGHWPSSQFIELFMGVGEGHLSRKPGRQKQFNRLLPLVSDADKNDLIVFFSVINGDEPPRGLK